MKRAVILTISLLILLPSFALGQYQEIIVSDSYSFNGSNNNKENLNWGEANLTLPVSYTHLTLPTILLV